MSNEYDIAAILYDPLLSIPLKSIRRQIIADLKEYKNKTILDLCCGTGDQLNQLSKEGFTDLSGLDLSKAMITIAKKVKTDISYFLNDATDTRFKESSVDAIIISFAIHEKSREVQEALLKEIHRILKPNAIVIIADFIFDDQTTFFVRKGISFIERLAGKEHFGNFKNYIKNDGLTSLIETDKFKFIKNTRRTLKGVTVSVYSKV